MTVILKLEGELAPVPFVVKPHGLFGVSFIVEDEKRIKQTDRMISRHRCFSLTPAVGVVKFIGRLLKITVVEETVIYAFMADEVRVLKPARKVD